MIEPPRPAPSTNGMPRLARGAFVGLSLLALAGIVDAFAGARDARRAVERTHAQTDLLQEMAQALQATQNSEQGYLITGDAAFVAAYARERAGTLGALARLRAYETNAPPIAGLSSIENQVRRALSQEERTVAQRAVLASDPGAAAASVRAAETLMTAARVSIAKGVAEQAAALATGVRAQRRKEAVETLVILLSQLASLGLVLVVGGLLETQLQRRVSAERVSLEQTALMRGVLDSVEHGIALLDGDGRLLACNGRLVDLLELVETPRLGLPLEGRFDTDALRTAVGAAVAIDAEHRTRDGRHVALVGRPAMRGAYLATFTDVTSWRRAEQAKTDFVSNVSHELRTPLTAIRGALGLLRGPLRSGLPERSAKLVALADRNAARLLTLVNDILDLDKIESGNLEFTMTPTDLNVVATESAEYNLTYADAKEVTLALGCLDEEVLVLADAERLQQVMANLISNAIKFSPPRGIVTIAVDAQEARAEVSVNDRGEGIPEDFQQRIFEKFAQAATGDSRTTGGSGLGLAIARSIVRRHGGDITFETRPGNTTFAFSIPRHGAPPAAA